MEEFYTTFFVFLLPCTEKINVDSLHPWLLHDRERLHKDAVYTLALVSVLPWFTISKGEHIISIK